VELFLLLLFTHPAPTDLFTLSLHDALPICPDSFASPIGRARSDRASGRAARSNLRSGRRQNTFATHRPLRARAGRRRSPAAAARSEEHTSELQSPYDLVCRLLLEKKKNDET